MSIRNLDSLFDPASVVVIGASDRPARVGSTVWHNLRHGSYGGTLMAVNPKYRQLDDLPVVARVQECTADWCRISADGEKGWVQKSALWGVAPGEVIE